MSGRLRALQQKSKSHNQQEKNQSTSIQNVQQNQTRRVRRIKDSRFQEEETLLDDDLEDFIAESVLYIKKLTDDWAKKTLNTPTSFPCN